MRNDNEIEFKRTPTYDEIEARGGPQNALEQFVNDNEPSDLEQARRFHSGLAAALEFTQGQGESIAIALADASAGSPNTSWIAGTV